MAGHPQNSPRGLFSKQAVQVGNYTLTDNGAGAVALDGALSVTGALTAGNSLTLGTKTLTTNSTGLIFPTRTALPTTRQVGGVCFVANSTVKALAFHSTGTTWVYVDSTT